MFSTRSVSIFNGKVFSDESPIKYNEILPFALYLTVYSSVRTFAAGKKDSAAAKKNSDAYDNFKFDLHAYLLHSFRHRNSDANSTGNATIKFTDLFTGTKRDKEHYPSPWIRGPVILSRLLWFGLKVAPELAIRTIDIATEKLAVDSYKIMQDPENNIALRAVAGLTALAISSIFVPVKIASICLRSITSHQEVWMGAKMIDWRFWPKAKLLGVGPAEFLARSLTFTLITAATIIFPPLIVKTAPVLGTVFTPILKPIISLAKPVLGPVLKPIGAFCAKNIANPLTKALTSTSAKAIATATKSAILVPLTTLVVAPMKYLQKKLNIFLFGEYKPAEKAQFECSADSLAESDDSSSCSSIYSTSSSMSEEDNRLLQPEYNRSSLDVPTPDFSRSSSTSSNASILSQLINKSSNTTSEARSHGSSPLTQQGDYTQLDQSLPRSESPGSAWSLSSALFPAASSNNSRTSTESMSPKRH